MKNKKKLKTKTKAKKTLIKYDIRGKVKLAETFGVSVTTVNNWISKGCPAKKIGGIWFFNFESVDQWNQTREEGLGKPDPELTKQRARLVKLTADRREIELLKMKGELLPVREAMRVWGAMIIAMRNRLEAMENRLPPMLYGLAIPDIKDVLSKYINEMREELANPDLKKIAKEAGVRAR